MASSRGCSDGTRVHRALAAGIILIAPAAIGPFPTVGAPLRRRRNSGIQFQALGQSPSPRQCCGLSFGVLLTAGEAHDVTAYDELIERRDCDPGATLADKGSDSDAIRHDLQDRGSAPEIATKSNRTVQRSVSKRLYRLRSLIECFMGHLKEQRRIATRYDKTAISFLGFILLGCFRLWIRFVHRAQSRNVLVKAMPLNGSG
jgi:transposase